MSTVATAREPREARNTFSHELVVDDGHIDQFGHANNVVILGWIQDVAEAHSASVGFPLAAYERLGAAFVVRRHEIDYLRPSVRGDRLWVRTWVSTARSASCSRGTEITSAEDGRVMVTAMTTWVFAELATLRLARIPDDVRLAFGFDARRRGDATASND
ncbi:MAG: acyl-CoA thioesterase [Labilithrix sp.]|nr:acyl-CoA thioesterase [Labilithrix sp.]MCW5816365.1 acyl-CoA thioesterase [Labilithrix sp.]